MADKQILSEEKVDKQAEQENKSEEGQVWRQYFFAGVANIAFLSTGYIINWPSIAEPPDAIEFAAMWYPLGCIFGPFVASALSSRSGRTRTMAASAVPIIIGWIFVALRYSLTFIAGRVCNGIGIGMLYTVSTMYCAEIATVDKRGALVSSIMLFEALGMLLAQWASSTRPYEIIATNGIILVSLSATASLFFLPESPIYYMIKNDKESATKSLMYLRGKSRDGVQSELASIEADVQDSITNTSSIVDVFRGNNLKALFICCALFFFRYFCGNNLIVVYIRDTLEQNNSSMNIETYFSISMILMVVGLLVALTLVDRIGRRNLLLISTSGAAIASVPLFIYKGVCLWSYGYEDLLIYTTFNNHLGQFAYMLYIFSHSLGLGPMPFVIMSELFSIKHKAAATSIIVSFSWILVSLGSVLIWLRVWPTPYAPNNIYATFVLVSFGLLAAVCIAGFFFMRSRVPETMGKSFAEIQPILAEIHEQKDSDKQPLIYEKN